MELEFAWLLFEIVTVDPFVTSFLVEFLLEVFLSVRYVVKLLDVLIEVSGIMILTFLNFTSGGPNNPLLLVISLKQLELKYTNLTQLIVVNILKNELAGVVF